MLALQYDFYLEQMWWLQVVLVVYQASTKWGPLKTVIVQVVFEIHEKRSQMTKHWRHFNCLMVDSMLLESWGSLTINLDVMQKLKTDPTSCYQSWQQKLSIDEKSDWKSNYEWKHLQDLRFWIWMTFLKVRFWTKIRIHKSSFETF